MSTRLTHCRWLNAVYTENVCQNEYKYLQILCIFDQTGEVDWKVTDLSPTTGYNMDYLASLQTFLTDFLISLETKT